MAYDAIDLFAGPGGWDVGAHAVGLSTIGLEWDDAAVQTRFAAGLPTIHGDVREYGPSMLGLNTPGLIASPPCQTFSAAGKGAGRAALGLVLVELARVAAGEEIRYDVFDDERTGLVLEPLRWARDGNYSWLAFEQVPTVLPVWEAMADVLRGWGYSVATGRLSAEQYGVPQTRKRAILIAARDRQVSLPSPTHRSFRKGVTRDEGDPALLPWVSMAQALGWGMTQRPYPTIACSRSTGGPDKEKVGGSGARKEIYAELEAGRWLVAAGADGAGKPVPQEHPAPTITGKGTAAWVDDPGNWYGQGSPADRQPAPSVRVSIDEASLLQSFPADYPWQGTKTKQFQQIGNAVPPLLAQAVLTEAAGLSLNEAPEVLTA